MTDLQEAFAVSAAIGLAIGLRVLAPVAPSAVRCPIYQSWHLDCISWELRPAHAPASLTAGPQQRPIDTAPKRVSETD